MNSGKTKEIVGLGGSPEFRRENTQWEPDERKSCGSRKKGNGGNEGWVHGREQKGSFIEEEGNRNGGSRWGQQRMKENAEGWEMI